MTVNLTPAAPSVDVANSVASALLSDPSSEKPAWIVDKPCLLDHSTAKLFHIFGLWSRDLEDTTRDILEQFFSSGLSERAQSEERAACM